MIAVCVRFQIAPGREQDFLPLMLENARASLAGEPGCHQFDVCTDPARPGEVFLYEIYASPAAFEDHLASAHFKAFDAATAPMVADKQVSSYREVAQ